MATARKSNRKGQITITLDDTEARYLYSLLGHHTPYACPLRSLWQALDKSPIGYDGPAMQEILWQAQPKGRPLFPLPLPVEDN